MSGPKKRDAETQTAISCAGDILGLYGLNHIVPGVEEPAPGPHIPFVTFDSNPVTLDVQPRQREAVNAVTFLQQMQIGEATIARPVPPADKNSTLCFDIPHRGTTLPEPVRPHRLVTNVPVTQKGKAASFTLERPTDKGYPLQK